MVVLHCLCMASCMVCTCKCTYLFEFLCLALLCSLVLTSCLTWNDALLGAMMCVCELECRQGKRVGERRRDFATCFAVFAVFTIAGYWSRWSCWPVNSLHVRNGISHNLVRTRAYQVQCFCWTHNAMRLYTCHVTSHPTCLWIIVIWRHIIRSLIEPTPFTTGTWHADAILLWSQPYTSRQEVKSTKFLKLHAMP